MCLWILLLLSENQDSVCSIPYDPFHPPDLPKGHPSHFNNLTLHALGPRDWDFLGPKKKTALGRVLSSRTIFFSISFFSLLQPNMSALGSL